LADANKEDLGLRENYFLVKALASQPSTPQRDSTGKIWLPEKNARSLVHLAELLPTRQVLVSFWQNACRLIDRACQTLQPVDRSTDIGGIAGWLPSRRGLAVFPSEFNQTTTLTRFTDALKIRSSRGRH
jgi:hypothetical protein